MRWLLLGHRVSFALDETAGELIHSTVAEMHSFGNIDQAKHIEFLPAIRLWAWKEPPRRLWTLLCVLFS